MVLIWQKCSRALMAWTSRARMVIWIPRDPRLAVHPWGRIVFPLPPRLRRSCKMMMLPNGVVLRRHSRMIRCSMLLPMGSYLNRTVHSSFLGCVICMGWPSQPTACLLSLKAPSILIIGNRMRVFERGWVLVQRRRQRCSRGQGQKVKESEVKASFVFSNRAFPVGKKASFNSVCSSGGCNDNRSQAGILSTPASSCLDSDRSSSAPGVMDPGDFEGTFVSELVKVALAITGY